MSLCKEKLIEFLVSDLDIPESDLDDNTPLFSSGIQDSFSMVSLLSFIEVEQQITLQPEEVTLENLDTINNIMQFIEKK